MKQKLIAGLAITVLSFLSGYAFTQDRTRTPDWVSDKGYWVLESNTHSPLEHIIWFYTNDNTLVYKETLSGVKLDPSKRKVKMKLKRALEDMILVWEKKKGPEPVEETALLRNVLYK
jgi:hypothetical protein